MRYVNGSGQAPPPPVQPPSPGEAPSYPQYPMQQGPGGYQQYPAYPAASPPPQRKSLKEALLVIPAGILAILSVLVSLFFILLFLSLLGYFIEFFAVVMCGFLILSIFVGIYYMFQPRPTPNYNSQFSLNSVKDPSKERKGGGHGPPQYAPPGYQYSQPPPPSTPPPPTPPPQPPQQPPYDQESSDQRDRTLSPPEY